MKNNQKREYMAPRMEQVLMGTTSIVAESNPKYRVYKSENAVNAGNALSNHRRDW